MGTSFPFGSVSVLRMQNGAPPRNGKSLLPASGQGSSDFPIAARQKSRLFDPCGGPARQGVIAATDCYMESEEEDLPCAAWADFRGAKKARKGSIRGPRGKTGGAKKVREKG